ncbi:unnamed protein product [marine sediment metagenome]|uniref:Molybdopterin dinucleotide-binding domain-containing protein n=1 Tax=marine sediment metagenome TaxID=412755 RepID=X1BDZ1_9ZZZZ
MDVPGGTLGWPPVSMGYPETGRFIIMPRPCKDGMLTTGTFMEHKPWPVEESRVPTDITLKELIDRVLKYYFGPEHGLDYICEHGSVNWPKQVKEAYWRPFINVRVPVYQEHIARLRPHVIENAKPAGIELEWEQFTPLVSYFKPQVMKEEEPQYDLYCFSYRDILHTGSSTMQLPWLDEASRLNPYTYNITLNVATANKKGLKDGDLICLESSKGRRVTGTLKTMQGQHLLAPHPQSWRNRHCNNGSSLPSCLFYRQGPRVFLLPAFVHLEAQLLVA